MNKIYPILIPEDMVKHEQAVAQFLANARRGQSCVVFFNDPGTDILTLPAWKQRMVDKMANRILSHDALFIK